MDKWGYSYLIELKTLQEKEKLLVASNFSFFHNFFKSCLLLMCRNEYMWSKGLRNNLVDIINYGDAFSSLLPEYSSELHIKDFNIKLILVNP